jgi:hypothetical protein
MTASGILKADSESVSDHSQAEKALATGNKSSISVEDAAKEAGQEHEEETANRVVRAGSTSPSGQECRFARDAGASRWFLWETTDARNSRSTSRPNRPSLDTKPSLSGYLPISGLARRPMLQLPRLASWKNGTSNSPQHNDSSLESANPFLAWRAEGRFDPHRYERGPP